MDDRAVITFVEGQDMLVLASQGHDGFPHVVPLSFAILDGEIWVWSFTKAQKVRNLERDPHCTVMLEAGESYDAYRGLMLRCEAELHSDATTVARVGRAIAERYGAIDGVEALLEHQVPKRTAIRLNERGRRVSWDHRKLTGRHTGEG
jgi:nitroimidazol reductase NimA-like FMN-containing flavoprotein (pyridoxamine 5'-phosphate oxidase superfamily)